MLANIVATGGGADANIRAVGSAISAGNTVSLAASKNTWEQHGTNKSSGDSVGLGFSTGRQNGFTIELGVSQGGGRPGRQRRQLQHTHVSGGKAVNVTSGSALTVRDAFIGAPKVTADVGGNLNIESLQDASSKRARDLEKSVKPADKPDSVHRHLLAKTPA